MTAAQMMSVPATQSRQDHPQPIEQRLQGTTLSWILRLETMRAALLIGAGIFCGWRPRQPFMQRWQRKRATVGGCGGASGCEAVSPQQLPPQQSPAPHTKGEYCTRLQQAALQCLRVKRTQSW